VGSGPNCEGKGGMSRLIVRGFSRKCCLVVGNL